MQINKQSDISLIGNTIHNVAVAHSKRLFKSENNSQERAAVVFLTIRAEINQALFDTGFSALQIASEIDPTDVILEQMSRDGYVVDGLTPWDAAHPEK